MPKKSYTVELAPYKFSIHVDTLCNALVGISCGTSMVIFSISYILTSLIGYVCLSGLDWPVRMSRAMTFLDKSNWCNLDLVYIRPSFVQLFVSLEVLWAQHLSHSGPRPPPALDHRPIAQQSYDPCVHKQTCPVVRMVPAFHVTSPDGP